MATNFEHADPTTRDAFGAQRVSEKTTVQDSQNVLGFDTRDFYNAVIYDSASEVILAESSNASGSGVNGSFIGPLDPDSRMVPLELGVPILYSHIDDLTILQDTLTIAAIRGTTSTTVGFATLNIEEVRQ